MPKPVKRILIVSALLFSYFLAGKAQGNAHTAERLQLFNEIALQDSILFNAFNSRDLDRMKQYFTSDLEVFQDNTGLRNFQQTVAAFGDLFKKEYVLTRTLVKASMEVYPIKGFGAIQTGSHVFSHIENGKMESATFKFTHIWQKTAQGWKIKRLITYDH